MGLRRQKNTTERSKERPGVQTPERRQMDPIPYQTTRTWIRNAYGTVMEK